MALNDPDGSYAELKYQRKLHRDCFPIRSVQRLYTSFNTPYFTFLGAQMMEGSTKTIINSAIFFDPTLKNRIHLQKKIKGPLLQKNDGIGKCPYDVREYL